ncbi:MAG: hypothetical protein PHQ91_14400 [Thermoanaerobaculaceae bacterium]|nr:hypothetical protein [Thermoanaerobaculaceae bacterium]
MKPTVVTCFVLAVAAAAGAAADALVLPIFALRWPGKAGNQWSSEVFLTNPGPATVNVSSGRFLPGTLKVGVPCYPPIAASRAVPAYSTVVLSPQTLALDLGCPVAALGGMAFDADGPVVVSSRIVNDRGLTPPGDVLAGFGQDLPAFGPADLAAPGFLYQLPGLVFNPAPGGPLAFEVYLYLANPGSDPVEVTLQDSRDGAPGELVLNGRSVTTPYAFTIQPAAFLQLTVAAGGIYPTSIILPYRFQDLFFTATGGVAVVASVVDRSSQDARTVLPVRTSD